MFQEVITYLIIGAAIAVAVMKLIKQFGGKKKDMTSTSSNSDKTHNCAECAAECQLRDLPRAVIEKNSEDCIPIQKKSKLFQP